MAIAISIVWITATLLVGPSGDFPLGLELPTHDRVGRMRPAFTTADLVMPCREHLAIGHQLIQRLRMRLATLRGGADRAGEHTVIR